MYFPNFELNVTIGLENNTITMTLNSLAYQSSGMFWWFVHLDCVNILGWGSPSWFVLEWRCSGESNSELKNINALYLGRKYANVAAFWD